MDPCHVSKLAFSTSELETPLTLSCAVSSFRVTWSNAFPPLLPISFIVPVGYAFQRLAKLRVTCSNSDSILMAGKVDVAFFDKTGTLTWQGLDYESCRSAESWNIGMWSSNILSVSMASCHALTKANDGRLIGNPVDKAMFKAITGSPHLPNPQERARLLIEAMTREDGIQPTASMLQQVSHMIKRDETGTMGGRI